MPPVDLASPDKKTIQQLFDGIALRYDFLNTFLSFRLDDFWRRRACDLIGAGAQQTVLDLGVGTGKFLRLFLNERSWKQAVGLDFSCAMLDQARRQLPAETDLLSGDFHDLPFKESTFDLVVSSFALRSVKEMPGFLGEVYRVLTSGGKAAFLCLTRPRNVIWKALYYPYLKWYMPFLGRVLSGNPAAYRFLSQSIQTFQDPAQTAEMMRDAGFEAVKIHPFTFGTCTLILGKK